MVKPSDFGRINPKKFKKITPKMVKNAEILIEQKGYCTGSVNIRCFNCFLDKCNRNDEVGCSTIKDKLIDEFAELDNKEYFQLKVKLTKNFVKMCEKHKLGKNKK